MEEEIEIRETFNPDVLDRAPGWLMRWGVIAVTLGIVALLCLAAVIPYDQTIRFPVTIGNEAATYIIAPQNGNIITNMLTGKQTVQKGDTLLVIATSGQSVNYLIASSTGYTVYPNSSVLNEGIVTAGDTLVKIFPSIDAGKKITAVGYYDELIQQDRLQKSETVIKISKVRGNSTSVKSSILYASLIPEAGKGYMVVIVPDSNSIVQMSTRTPLYHNQQAEAAITLKKRSIIQWIFDH